MFLTLPSNSLKTLRLQLLRFVMVRTNKPAMMYVIRPNAASCQIMVSLSKCFLSDIGSQAFSSSPSIFVARLEPCKQSCFTYSPCKRLYDVTIPPQTSQEDHAPTGRPLSQMVQTQYNEEEPSPMQPETTTEQSFIPKQEISQPTDPFSAEVMCDALSIEADGGMSCRHKCDSLGCCASGNCRPNQVLDCKDFDLCIHAFPVKYKYFTI